MSNENKLVKIFEELAEPWADEQLKFRIQRMAQDKKSWAQVAAYVDARDIEERFNRVCAKYDAEWSNEVEIVGQRTLGNGEREVVVRQTIRLDVGDKVYRHEDYGIGGDEKAAASDALKRAAVLFGMDGAYRGHEVWLGEGEFTERGRITVSHAELLERFKHGKRQERSGGSGGESGQSERRGCKDPNAPASSKAQGYAHGLMKKAGIEDKKHRAIFASIVSGGEEVDIENMTCQQASDIIEALTGEERQLWLDKLNEAIGDGNGDEEFPSEEDLPF